MQGNKEYQYRRGDIYFVDFQNEFGVRPALIVQNDKGNLNSITLIVVPVTTADKKCLPTHVKIKDLGSLKEDSVILCEDVYTIKKSSLKGYITTIVNTKYEKLVNEALRVSLALKEE